MKIPNLRLGAVAALAAVLFLGASAPARADIELIVSAGATTDVFTTASNTFLSTAPFTIDGYALDIHTVVTNYPGSPTNGVISTTVNILGAVTSGDTLTTTVELVSPPNLVTPFAAPLLPWSAPSTSIVKVSAAASFATNASVTSGLNTVTTYYDSPPAATFAGSTPVVAATQNPPNTTGNSFNTVSEPNTGTYTLSQTLVLTGINVGAAGFNFGGTSSVMPTPEPSSVAMTFMGLVPLAGLAIRRYRRRAVA